MPSGRYLSQKQRDEILRRYEKGDWPTKIARDLSVSRETVVRVARKKSDKSSPR